MRDCGSTRLKGKPIAITKLLTVNEFYGHWPLVKVASVVNPVNLVNVGRRFSGT
jgi:hypothetical protein